MGTKLYIGTWDALTVQRHFLWHICTTAIFLKTSKTFKSLLYCPAQEELYIELHCLPFCVSSLSALQARCSTYVQSYIQSGWKAILSPAAVDNLSVVVARRSSGLGWYGWKEANFTLCAAKSRRVLYHSLYQINLWVSKQEKYLFFLKKMRKLIGNIWTYLQGFTELLTHFCGAQWKSSSQEPSFFVA